MNEIINFSVQELIDKISNSQVTSVEICEAYIERINKFEKEIKKHAISWSIGEIGVGQIDKENILNASFSAMHLALDKLEVRPEFIIVDGNSFRKYKHIDHKCIVKGDSKYLSIAAASILAKNYRDELMTKFSIKHSHYEWEKNFGYPTKSHRDGIIKYGITDLHRKSFKLL